MSREARAPSPSRGARGVDAGPPGSLPQDPVPRGAPFLSLVLPVRNEERFLRDTLRQIVRQAYPSERYEVLVVDGQSTDGTRRVAEEFAAMYPQVRILDNPGIWSSSGRNVGFRAARGDACLVLDGHCHIENDHLLESVAAAFASTGADCLGRPQPLDPPGLSRFQETVARARASWLGHSMKSLVYSDARGFVSPVSVGTAYRRHVFDRIGYVDEDFDACEDVEFNYRAKMAGLTCWVDPALTVRYYPRETLGGVVRQMFRYGRGRARFVRKHPAAINIDMVTPAAFVLLLGLLLAAVVVGRGLVWLPGGLLAVYEALILLESVSIARRVGVYGLAAAPLVLFAIHVGIGTGFLFELLTAPWNPLRRAPSSGTGGPTTQANRPPDSPLAAPGR